MRHHELHELAPDRGELQQGRCERTVAAIGSVEQQLQPYAKLLAPEDVLTDTMRGRSSTWTRIRVNLKNVPEGLRPPQEAPDPDDDPTRAWRAAKRKKAVE